MNCILLPADVIDDKVQDNNDTVATAINDVRNQNRQYLQCYTLTDAKQVRHIKTVLRAKVGDRIKVGIKFGYLGIAAIEQLADDHIVLTQVNCDIAPPAKLDLTVVLALCRPKVLRRLVMDMTAIGVQRIVLVNSYRTQKSYWQSPMLQRLDEFVDEGLSQSMDTVAPIIESYTRFKPFVEDILSQWTQPSALYPQSDRVRSKVNCQSAIVAHPYASQSFHDYLDQQLQHSTTYNNSQNLPASQLLPQIICIGAEGGWIDFEIDLLEANGCKSVSLGTRILRTEAMVNALCGRYIG